MIEFDEEKSEEKKPKKIEEKKPKKKKKRKSPKTKGKGKPASWHPSPGKSRVARGETGKIRGEGGFFIGKRQIQMKIDYSFEEQNYKLEMKSGDGKIDEVQNCGGIPRMLFAVEKTIKKWRGELV
ncbi:MAG: hypothetical protein E3J76_03605 [Candidatus Aminicenantes bacterium]|nr:MAG: hypothetical protein E3J76_03605 [Candidatus Aminicenantes bacterium]